MKRHDRGHRGRLLLSGLAGLTAVSGYLADWNRTHLYNPRWPPHAKFHDAWSILLGTGLGGFSLYLLWRRGTDPELELSLGAGLTALFWAGQAGSYLFPGTAGMESEFPHLLPRAAGIPLNEAAASAGMLALTATAYAWARRS
jgi:hypothetical protein